jgi:L-alanine-DL-glutamate epimerase-like enolase superfamily enzyme
MLGTTIRSLAFFDAVSDLSRPIADATHQISKIAFIVARIELECGITGDGFLLAFDYSPGAIRGALSDIRRLVVGRDAAETGLLAEAWRAETEYFGSAGLQRWAAGLVDVALWDAWGKHLGQPVWRLLGMHAGRVPLYGSGGWLSYSTEELAAEAAAYKKRGFRAVKIKVGSPDLERDVERLRKVREAVGPDIKIMMDANQGLRLPEALALARRAAPIGIHWFEEPLVNTDFDGYAEIRRQAGISIAMGEREYDTAPLRELLARKAIDLWQPDILRLGGVEAWRASAAVARAHHVPVLPHFYKEYDVPLLCTIGNGCGAESFDWVDGLIDRPLRVEEGWAWPHTEPGWGFAFKDEKLRAL